MDAIEEVKSRLAIEDVIGEYVQLKRAGHNLRGLSPFNNEKTPSFMVSPEKQIWHDFSSNKGGNMFSFVMDMEGLDFKGALELLAKKAGVDLDQYRQSSSTRRSGPDKQRLLTALDQATRFYQVQLRSNREALKYVLNERGLTKETVLLWRLGYSPNTGTALIDYLQKQGYSEAEIRLSGLSSKRNGRSSDMFRGRLMIPLQDPQGQVIGFTARALTPSDYGPKYINTPQTILYDKSRHIFGLHLAKAAIRQAGFVIITEGNLDVISSHQAGIAQTVATAGTALTDSNLKALTRFSSDIRLCFDADKAGLAATERAISIASRLHVSLNIIDISGGKDPDELIRQNPQLWLEAVNNYTYALDWLIKRQESLSDIHTAEGKRHFTDAILPTINNLDDAVERDHYLNLIATKIKVNRQALEDKSAKTVAGNYRPIKRQPKVTFEAMSKEQLETIRFEDHFLCLMLKQPTLRSQLNSITEDMISREESRELLKVLKKQPSISEEDLYGLETIGDYVKIEALQYEELYQDLELSELSYEAARLQMRLIKHYVQQQKLNITQQLVNADEKTTEKLLSMASQLDELLRLNLGENNHAQKE